METNNKIASLSISGEITLNLHSLNNEGGEGNQTITRQVTIVDKEGITHTVNAISGDMFKHIHVGHLINLAKERDLDLCSNCKLINPNRLSS
jgi:CRISPR-associated protein Cst2